MFKTYIADLNRCEYEMKIKEKKKETDDPRTLKLNPLRGPILPPPRKRHNDLNILKNGLIFTYSTFRKQNYSHRNALKKYLNGYNLYNECTTLIMFL